MYTFTDAQVLRLVNMTIQGSNLPPVAFGSGGVRWYIRGPMVEIDEGG